jgi:hypothetical protein
MHEAILLAAAAMVTFAAHDLFELAVNSQKIKFRFIVFGWHFHHSVLGILVGLAGFAFASGGVLLVCCGYTVGNLLQHKVAHNRVNEPGMVFVTRDY